VGGVTYLEMQLEHVQLNFLVDDSKEVEELLKYDQPLGTFGGRIRVAYCLGLISKVIRDDLRRVGKKGTDLRMTSMRRSRSRGLPMGAKRCNGTRLRIWHRHMMLAHAIFSMWACIS